MDSTSVALNFIELNPERSNTIILLHDLTGSLLEWEQVQASLVDYHLLIPDLPRHSGSRKVRPLTIRHAAAACARLIRDHAHGSQAFAVGISMGGFVALEVAHSYPDLVRAIFISGTYDMKRAFPKGMYALPWVSAFIRHFVPSRVDQEQHRKKGIMWSRAFTRDARANSRLSIVQQGAREIRHFDLSRLVVRQKTLAVAATRMDSVNEVAALVGVLKQGNVESTGAYVEDAEHQWNLQRPELFAAGIQAWFEHRDLPEEFRHLTTVETGE
ncbi:hypothetical protein EHS25_008978 [Saitozyma podzolica]|uniref:AB hydrolase-1 domain-containing protein n=1 Tax=Saitozyma podzolica TaxID=1890683 RepID=A0A427YKK9_9TREE|nr:hypothetical protein EHS25_008978 [Saitozyma podzolica]